MPAVCLQCPLPRVPCSEAVAWSDARDPWRMQQQVMLISHVALQCLLEPHDAELCVALPVPLQSDYPMLGVLDDHAHRKQSQRLVFCMTQGSIPCMCA
jgi:hypothetical protein